MTSIIPLPDKVFFNSEETDFSSEDFLPIFAIPESITIQGVEYTLWRKMAFEQYINIEAIYVMAMAGHDVYRIDYRVNQDVYEEAEQIEEDGDYCAYLCTGVDFAHPCRITRLPVDPVKVADDVSVVVYEDKSAAAWCPPRKEVAK